MSPTRLGPGALKFRATRFEATRWAMGRIGRHAVATLCPASQTLLTHEPRNAMSSEGHSLCMKLSVNAGTAVPAPMLPVNGSHMDASRNVRPRTHRGALTRGSDPNRVHDPNVRQPTSLPQARHREVQPRPAPL